MEQKQSTEILSQLSQQMQLTALKRRISVVVSSNFIKYIKMMKKHTEQQTVTGVCVVVVVSVQI